SGSAAATPRTSTPGRTGSFPPTGAPDHRQHRSASTGRRAPVTARPPHPADPSVPLSERPSAQQAGADTAPDPDVEAGTGDGTPGTDDAGAAAPSTTLPTTRPTAPAPRGAKRSAEPAFRAANWSLCCPGRRGACRWRRTAGGASASVAE